MCKILALFLLATPIWATWTMVHKTTHDCSPTVSTCTVTVPSTATGNVIIVQTQFFASTTITSITGGSGTYALCGAPCQATNIDMAYTLNSTGGITSVIVNLAGTISGLTCIVVEFHMTQGPAIFDVGGKVNDATCTSCAGVGLTLSGANDVIMQGGAGGTVSAVTPPYVTAGTPDGNWYGYALNTGSGAAPTLTQSSAGFSIGALAIKETFATAMPVVLLLDLFHQFHP